jgi:excisionase family DNA binding protein
MQEGIANTSDSAKYLSILEAALRAGVSPDTIRRRIKDGSLPATKFAEKWRIRTSDLDALVEGKAA